MQTFARVVLFALVAIGVLVASAEADTVYTYTGDTFTFVQGVYSPGDRITGNFVLSGAFVPGVFAGRQTVTNDVVSYSFTDGHQTLTQSNSTGIFQVGFNLDGTPVVPGTDGANGFWLVDLRTPTSGILTELIVDYQMEAWIGGAGPPGIHNCNGSTSTDTSLPICFTDPTISAAAILGLDARAPGLPGTWTVQRVPEPMTLVLVGVGIAWLAAVGRARRRALP